MAWKIKKNDFPTIRERLPALFDETVAWAAQEVANQANAAAPTAQSGAEFSSGAASVSYYAASRHSNGYDQALSDADDAASKAGNDLFESGDIAPKIVVEHVPGIARAFAASAIKHTYAIEHGFFLGRPGFYFGGKFYPVKAPGHMVAARPHFFPAVDKVRPKFFKQLERDLKSVLTARPPTVGGTPGRRLTAQERMDRDEAKYRDREVKRHRRENRAFIRQQNSERHDILDAHLGNEGMRRQINSGNFTKNGKRFRETFNERAERLKNEFDQIMFNNNNRSGGF